MIDDHIAHELRALERIVMARIDELVTTVASIKASVDSALAEIATLDAKLAAAQVEDPRIGQAVDQLAAIKTSIGAVLTPATPTPVQG